MALIARDDGYGTVKVFDVSSGKTHWQLDADVNQVYLSGDESRCVLIGKLAISSCLFFDSDRQMDLVRDDFDSQSSFVILVDVRAGVTEKWRVEVLEERLAVQVVLMEG